MNIINIEFRNEIARNSDGSRQKMIKIIVKNAYEFSIHFIIIHFIIYHNWNIDHIFYGSRRLSLN